MRKPCRNLKPTLKPTLNRPQYILKQPWTNPKETMSLWWPTRHAAGQSPLAPSGAVEGDWLRRGGWLTHCGLTLLVGDRFRLVSVRADDPIKPRKSQRIQLASIHLYSFHTRKMSGMREKNKQTTIRKATYINKLVKPTNPNTHHLRLCCKTTLYI